MVESGSARQTCQANDATQVHLFAGVAATGPRLARRAVSSGKWSSHSMPSEFVTETRFQAETNEWEVSSEAHFFAPVDTFFAIT
jgi:hypothetical protein